MMRSCLWARRGVGESRCYDIGTFGRHSVMAWHKRWKYLLHVEQYLSLQIE